MKHTPGPWHVWQGAAIKNIWRVHASDAEGNLGVAICECSTPQSTATALANARLIAAAPELLEALRVLLAATARIDGYEDLLTDPEHTAIHLIARIDGKDA